jgi:hypothetical protein
MNDTDTTDQALFVWLRALPHGAILLDSDEDAWQVRTGFSPNPDGSMRFFPALSPAGSEESYELADDGDMKTLLEQAPRPWTVIWLPPIGGVL